MSIRCMLRTPENLKEVDKLLEKFPYMKEDREIMIAHISGWQSKNLRDNEDRLPTASELNEYLKNSPKVTNKQGQINISEKEDYTKIRPFNIGWARTAENGYEVSTRGDKRFSAFVATFKKDTIIEGVDVGGKTIEYVYQNIFKKSGKGRKPSEDSVLRFNPVARPEDDNFLDTLPKELAQAIANDFIGKKDATEAQLQDYSYYRIYLPLWQEWARQNPELMNELREKSKGKILTDQFANTRVSQARALSDILNSTNTQQSQVRQENQLTVSSYLGDITPDNNTIFVFGSNPEGRHGAGAAKIAREKFGAIYGQGEGLQGNAYALPTKDLRVKENNSLRSIPREQIIKSIKKLYETARQNPSKQFKIAYRNTNKASLNGYTGLEMIDMFLEAGSIPSNIVFSKEWVDTGKFNKVSVEQLIEQLTDFEAPQVQSFAEDIAKVNQTFNPITRKNIINKIGRMFSNEVTRLLEERKEELNRRINTESNIAVKRELIDDLKNLSRFEIIKRETPYKIFKEIEDAFRVYADASFEDRYELELELINNNPNNNSLPDSMKQMLAKTIAERKADTYKKILDNFQVLAEEASSMFAITEGISMDINPKYNYVIRDKNTDAVDENGETQDSSVENKEEQYKDGWITNVREVSSFSSLSNRVRRSISNIARVNKRGVQEVDEFGDTVYLEASYVHASLIQALRDMVTAEDMIPLLEKFATRMPWASQIVEEVKNNPRLFTSFYRAYRKDYLNYWIQKQKIQPDGSVKFQTISINKSEGTAHYFDEWRDNYEFGNILDSDSLYDKNGDIDLSKASIGLEIVNRILGRFPREATREEEIEITNSKETFSDLQKALGMLGISVDDKTLTNSLNYNIDDKRFPLPIYQILDNLRTIYYDLSKGNEKVVNGQPADLINIYGTAFNNIAEAINKVDDDSVESSVRQGDKTRYAHTNPSYLTTLIKKLKRDDFKAFMDREYKTVNWFYDEKTGWKNELMKELYENPEAREQLNHTVLLEFNKKEYVQWTETDATLALINMYFSSPTKNEEGYAYYQIPMLSDSQSAEFIKLKRYIENFEEVINNKFINLVKQEIDRISLVNKRYNNNADEIANFDRVNRKDGTLSKGGAEFKFFPELNRAVYGAENNRTFLDIYNEMLSTGATNETIDTFIKNTIASIMEDRFNSAKERWQKIGLLDRVNDSKDAKYKYFNRYSEKGVDKDLREWYWNSTFAQSQIIQLLTTDLAYYKNLEDFQKRNKQVHAPSEKLNTFATWNVNGVEVPVLERVPLTDAKGNKILDSNGKEILIPRKERCIYLKDSVVESIGLKDIEEIIDAKIKKGELTQYDKAVIIGTYKKINIADAQAYRTLDSFRATQIMADMWSEEEEEAYNNFKNNKWSARDFTVLWNTRKPYLYTQTNQSNQVDDGLIRVPTQHKNSEMLLLTQAIFGEILSSPKMKALSDFMEQNHIDVAHFESVVKDGKQGVIDLNDIDSNDYQGVIDRLNEATSNPNYVHEFDYNDYGIQTATPEHGIDAVQLLGTQIRRLIGADMSKDAKFKYGDKEWTVEQWFNYYNAVNVANIRTAFEALDKKFSDIREIQKELIREVRSNPRYGTDLIQALSLNDRGEFNIPLDDPSQTLRIQALLNSILKSKITKQKIAGGALIQASSYGLSRKPKIVYEGEGDNKRIKYMECYIPCPTEELYNLLLDPNTHELDINKKDSNGNYIVPRKYLEVIGYRVPTEDKYSMAPLKVIGFLPRQVGSVIILPEEITGIAGSDFDVDKLYVMFHTLAFDNYDIRKAKEDYEKENNIINELFKQFTKSELAESLLENDPSFKEWFNQNKDKYKYKQPKARVVNFRFNNNVSNDDKMAIYNLAKSQTKEQRDSLIIDLMWSVLTNSDTTGRFINPGGFEEQKRSARIVATLDNLDLNTFKQKFKSVEDFLNLPLDSTDDIIGLEDIAEEFKELLNPLTPDTWVALHQRNMSGASLIGIAANHNASQAIMQRTNLGVANEYVLKFNGNKYSSLHNIRNVEGKFITRNIAGFLAAFVDNAKDPIAGDMNFNTYTADIAFTLLRLGVPVVTTALVLKQPIIVDIVNTASNNKISIQEAINKVLTNYKNKASGENINSMPSQKGINNYNFTDEELVTNILASHNPNIHGSIEEATFYSNQVKVGYMFSKLNKLASALGDLTQATRADTQNGAAGPTIADDVVKIERVEDILLASTKPDYPLTGIDFINFNMTEEDIINSKLPILQSFFTYGIESTEVMFKDLFPQYSDTYRAIINDLKAETKYNRLSIKTRNSIYNDIISYYLTQYSEFSNPVTVKTEDGETKEVSARDYYINYFPKEFKEFKEAHKELNRLSFINRLKVIGYTKYNPVSSIIFTNVGKVTPLQKEQYIREWTNLLYINDETRDIARKLFIYNCFKGFGFSPSGFSHLSSTIIKMDNTNYIKGLRNIGKQIFDVDNFWRQYILNHLDNRELVPDVSNSTVKIEPDTTEFTINITINSSYEDKQFAHPFGEEDEIIYHNYVHFNVKGRDIYFEYDSENNVYRKVRPLGIKNQYIEYEYGINAEAIESVIPEAVPNKVSFNDIYDDVTPTSADESNNSSFEYADISSLGLGNIIDNPNKEQSENNESKPMSRAEKVKSILSKYEIITPNTKDEFTDEDYCPINL